MRLFLATLGAVSVLLAGTVGSADAQTTTPAQRTLQRALTKSLRQAGRQSGAYVVDLTTGQVLFSQAANTGRLPASVEKIYTTSTALLRLGPTATFTTSILGIGSRDPSGVWDGTLYLRGGGDPTFGSVALRPGVVRDRRDDAHADRQPPEGQRPHRRERTDRRG